MNDKRKIKERNIRAKMMFIGTLFSKLQEDFEKGCAEQAKDDELYNLNYSSVNNHTRYANDVVRLRRELHKLWNLLMSS